MIDTFIVFVWILICALTLFLLYELFIPVFRRKVPKQIQLETSKDKITYLLNHGSLLIAVLAIQISLYTISQSNSERIEADYRYNVQRVKDSIQQSILYSSMGSLETMNSSFHRLDSSVNIITSKLDNIPTQIDNISGSFRTLNDVSQKQYSIMFDQYTSAQNQIKQQESDRLRELSKRPYIDINGLECGGGYVPSILSINNSGELPTIIFRLVLEIPEQITNNKVSIDDHPSKITNYNGIISIITENLGEIKEKRPRNLKIDWQFYNPVIEVFDVKYKLYYWNRNELDSTVTILKMCNITHN